MRGPEAAIHLIVREFRLIAKLAVPIAGETPCIVGASQPIAKSSGPIVGACQPIVGSSSNNVFFSSNIVAGPKHIVREAQPIVVKPANNVGSSTNNRVAAGNNGLGSRNIVGEAPHIVPETRRSRPCPRHRIVTLTKPLRASRIVSNRGGPMMKTSVLAVLVALVAVAGFAQTPGKAPIKRAVVSSPSAADGPVLTALYDAIFASNKGTPSRKVTPKAGCFAS